MNVEELLRLMSRCRVNVVKVNTSNAASVVVATENARRVAIALGGPPTGTFTYLPKVDPWDGTNSAGFRLAATAGWMAFNIWDHGRMVMDEWRVIHSVGLVLACAVECLLDD